MLCIVPIYYAAHDEDLPLSSGLFVFSSRSSPNIRATAHLHRLINGYGLRPAFDWPEAGTVFSSLAVNISCGKSWYRTPIERDSTNTV